MTPRPCRTVTTRTGHEYQAYCAVCGWLSDLYPWRAVAEAHGRGHEGRADPEPLDPWIRGPAPKERGTLGRQLPPQPQDTPTHPPGTPHSPPGVRPARPRRRRPRRAPGHPRAHGGEVTWLRIGSMFSGYGGLDVAVAQHFGGQVVWHAETDPHATKVLAHHWPDVPNLGDVTQVDWEVIAHRYPVDVLTAGYP